MAKGNIPLYTFNRGIITEEALARIDTDRTRLSAEIMTNWIPKTVGAMRIRPGTKYLGSSFNDTGAEWIEFAASTTQTALLELTPNKMRIWDNDVLLSRPKVDTTLSLSDTGWYDDSVGGFVITGSADRVPTMSGYTNGNVVISASSDNAVNSLNPEANAPAWKAFDDNFSDSGSRWADTGPNGSTLPSWINVDFGVGNEKTITSYTVRSALVPFELDNAPNTWRLLGSNYDTGTYATDTGKWALEDSRSGQTGWAAVEKRSYSLSDTGTADAWRHWRLYVTAADGDTELNISEIEYFDDGLTSQASFNAGELSLNAGAAGSTARAKKAVVVDTGDAGVEHSLSINVTRGPVTLRVGSTDGDDDYISETKLRTGYHNLAFTPSGTFYVTIQTTDQVTRTIGEFTIGDSGTVELTTGWNASKLDDIRYDQSADVVFVAAVGVKPQRIERRGTGRSWSVVDYTVNDGPFLSGRTSSADLGVSAKRGNAQLRSNIPFFKQSQVGSLFRLTHESQSSKWALGNTNAATDTIEVVGLSDTGTPTAENERRVTFAVTGTYKGTVVIERSFDGPQFGFKKVTSNFVTSGANSDTGTFTTTVDDEDDNITVFYRARLDQWDSGAAVVDVTYGSGAITGVARVTGYENNQTVDVEILRQFSDTGTTDDWEEGAWSEVRGYPTAVALHEGRLAQAGQANIWLSVSDSYESHDDKLEGDAAPLNRTLGSGPVDVVYYLVSLLRLVAGTAGSEIALKSSSLDEVLTPTNSSARSFSTQGSAVLRALKMDNRALFVQRSKQRVYTIGWGSGAESFNDYATKELSVLVPELLEQGVVSLAIQRQPDTRAHFVLTDGRVAIMTYEPSEDVLAWSVWAGDTGVGTAVERVAVLPGEGEDKVYYHVRRTINGVTRRFLERWAQESESRGDTGLSWIADCAVSYTDTGRVSAISDFAPHLAGAEIVAWADDTGQTEAGKDLTPDDTGGDQVFITVDTGGDVVLPSAAHHVVGGLPYQADFKSTKLAYLAQAGTALTQMKRVEELGLILRQVHNNGLWFGGDSGHLDPLPRYSDEEAEVDKDKIFKNFDDIAIPFNDRFTTDSRLFLRAKAPRPVTVMSAIPNMETNES